MSSEEITHAPPPCRDPEAEGRRLASTEPTKNPRREAAENDPPREGIRVAKAREHHIEAALRYELDRRQRLPRPETPADGTSQLHAMRNECVIHCAVLNAALRRLASLSDHFCDAPALANTLLDIEGKIAAEQFVDAAVVIVSAAAPALAQALASAGAPRLNQLLALVMEWQSCETVGVASRVLYLASFRLARMQIPEQARLRLMQRINQAIWKPAAELVLELPAGCQTELHQAFDLFWLKEFRCGFHRGLLELFSDWDLAAIVLAKMESVTPVSALPEEVLSEALTVIKSAVSSEEMRCRLLKIGLRRYSEWMLSQFHRVPPETQVNAVSFAEIFRLGDAALAKMPSISPAEMESSNHFLEAWDALTMQSCLEDIVKQQKTFVDEKVLMHPATFELLKGRLLPVDKVLIDVLTLPSKVSDCGQRLQTLVVTGESGSGKTLSMLALAKTANALCVYMRAAELLKLRVDDLEAADVSKKRSQDNECESIAFDLPRDLKKRNELCAKHLFKALQEMDTALQEPLKKPSANKRVVIIVDEAGEFPNLVRAMCSPELQLAVPLRGKMVSFTTYLGVSHVQLVVGGTGVSVMKEKCGSSPDTFFHVSMRRMKMKRVTQWLDGSISTDAPWIERILSQNAARDMREQIDEAKRNPRMHACIASTLLDKSVSLQSQLVKSEVSWLLDDDDRALSAKKAIRILSVVASVYAELKLCLESARMMFRGLNALGTLTPYGTQNHIFCALGYSCLQWDSVDCPSAASAARYGVIVDNIDREELSLIDGNPAAGAILHPGYASRDRRCVKTMLYRNPAGDLNAAVQYVLREACLHRYSVSGIHLRHALSIVGIERTVWTRLGFERIIMDLCYLHSLMALNTKDEELIPPRWRDIPTNANTHQLGQDSLSAEEEDKQRAIAFHRLATQPTSEITDAVKSMFDVAFDDTNVSVHTRAGEGNLFNDAALDPLRQLKAKIWSLAREQRSGGRVLLMKAQLPPPGRLRAKESPPPQPDADVKYKHVKSSDGTGKDLREDETWPRVRVDGKWKKVVPVAWLLRALERAVDREACDYFRNSGPSEVEVPLIVLGMLYEKCAWHRRCDCVRDVPAHRAFGNDYTQRDEACKTADEVPSARS